jgi:glycosyltransferase involved in cell wall biosynthesis
MPAVSILIPSYNHAAFLGPCIQSVLDQTFSDWELVIVDDVSSDNSVEVAKAFKDRRIRVYAQEANQGTYGTLNRALDLAEGELTAILDSDDLWAPTKLEKQVAAMQEVPDASFSYTYGTTTDVAGETRSDSHHRNLPRERVQNPICSLLIENRILASSLVFRRGSIRFDTSVPLSGDWVALLDLCRIGPAVFVDEPLTHWRIHGSNTSKWKVRAIMDEIVLRRRILSDPKVWELPGVDGAELNRSLAICAVRYHTGMVFAGDRAEERRALKLAAHFDPSSPSLWKRKALTFLPRPIMKWKILPGLNSKLVREAYLALPTVNTTVKGVKDQILNPK